jgi:hypothetical protein
MTDSEVKNEKPKKVTKSKKLKTKEIPVWNSPEAKDLYVEYIQAKIADPKWVYGTALPKGFIPETK